MRWITHIAIALLFVKLLEIALLVDLTSRYEFWVVLSIYAVVADFDSLLGIKHRTYTHTLYAALIVSLPLIFDLRLFIIALSAYLSHLFADMLTYYRESCFSIHSKKQPTTSCLQPGESKQVQIQNSCC